ncbi:ribosome small subunit-dependent GTPase A [Paucilactobacillus wasatchensis]|uniref:Small ribosomal subunit biogenesis GTPase RsgA n=1 Tax=Paucilactobacillus wasatchensis TaxID=1335616 RepID=A0A0D0YVY5_9LACO|nr:ribosome small subunit-dependent GTPase A [Paucilactobacillus wasatchensis]KIS03439.1 Ribosome small subunit-stimulated GTPase EngC [Paucilactobacillus wasatchensis]
MKKGIIQQSLSGFYDVLSDNELYRTRGRGNFRQKKIKPMVGDQVEFDGQNRHEGYLLKVLPRKNALTRPPIANVDVAIVVTAVREPIFSTNLLDRQLVALEAQKIKAIIYFTKTDLLNQAEYDAINVIVKGYQEAGYAVIMSHDPFEKQSLVALRKLISNQIGVVMGQTGAGKSTLLNHLVPSLALPTGVISQALQRGKHTTRKVSLLNIDNSLIADTPGFSSYETFDMTNEQLPLYFPEMAEIGKNCRFRGCLHLKEPNCAVKEAVANGTIMESRYNNYSQFHDLIVAQKPNYKK